MKKIKLLVFFLLTSLNLLAQLIPQVGIVAHYPFNGNANDVSSNSFHLTGIGATLCPDRFGRTNHAYQFDGINDYLFYGAALPQDSVYTFSFWYLSENSNQRGHILNNGNSAANGIGVLQNSGITSPQVPGSSISFFAGGVNFFYATATNINAWHHVVVRCNLDTFDFFYDNVWKYSGQFNSYSPNGVFFLGYNYIQNKDGFKGKIDDFALYNRALTLAEIDTLFHGCGQQITSQPANQTVLGGNNTMFILATAITSQATYQWQMDAGTGFTNLSNAGPFSGVNTDTLIISNVSQTLHNNDFRVILTNDIGCKDTSSAAKLLVTPNSIYSVSQEEEISVFPNPSQGKFVIKTNQLAINEAYTIEVSNLLGQTMIRKTLSGATLAHYTIDLNESGIYILTFTNAEQKIIARKKLVVE
ncbi:MAG TPA: T9SS type A sorting domain-containing protein [Flavipsychrobacter sp.]|nr:T9SS type A sorting domain-containing protein [Flavipsychrobacter sp.]